MGKNTCAVVGCWNRTGESEKIRLLRFPKHTERKKLWCDILGLISDDVNEGKRICSEHFTPDDFYFTKTRVWVKKNAVPIRQNCMSVEFNENGDQAHVPLPNILSQPGNRPANMVNMSSHGCLICADESIDNSLNTNNAEILCRLLRLPMTSSLLYKSSSKSYPVLLQSVTYCRACNRRIIDIGKLFLDLDELDQKLEESRNHIEERLKRSLEVGCLNLTHATKDFPMLSLNHTVLGEIISQLSEPSVFVNTFTRWTPEQRTVVVESNHAAQVGNIIPKFGYVLDGDNHGEDPGPPSPTPSFQSIESFEEKFIPPLDLSATVNEDFTTNEFTQETNKPCQELKSLVNFKNQRTKLSTTKRRILRTPCPFSVDCQVSLNRDDEISKQAHHRRYHQRKSNYYVCKVCGVGFTGYSGLMRHQEQLHTRENEHRNCVESAVFNSKVINATQLAQSNNAANTELQLDATHSQTKSEISNSCFPIVLIKKMENEHIVNPKSSYYKRNGNDETVESSKIDLSRSVHRKLRRTPKKRTKMKCSDSNRKSLNKTFARFKCPIDGCHLSFKVTEEHKRQAHIRKIHEGIKNCYRCDKCNIFFRYLNQWEKHQSVHTGVPAFVCKYCEFVCTSGIVLKVHMRTIHEPEKLNHKCNECGKAFMFKYKLESHMISHRNERPYMCEVCSETFRSHMTLKYHQAKHKEAFNCKLCGKKLSSPRSVRDHIKKIHTKTYALTCEICGYGAHIKSELERHFVQRHCDERNVKCSHPGCSAAFKLQYRLNIHMRRHTGERPYKCKTCGKGFISKSAISRHELIHSGEQCHECQVCGKTFPVRNYLYIHMRSHNKTNRKRKKGGTDHDLNQKGLNRLHLGVLENMNSLADT